MLGVGLGVAEVLGDCLASMGCSEEHIGVEDLDELARLLYLSDL